MTAQDMRAAFLAHAGVERPIICGAMYPCSNPELVAAVSEAGGLGIVQPIALTYVHGHKGLRAGIRRIRTLTDKPIGFNAIVEDSNKLYMDQMRAWIDVALEEGVRFFVTALGKPGWVVDRVQAMGGVVYHDVTARRWAEKAMEGGVDGLICVNRRAGGHAGDAAPEALYDDLKDLGVPLVLAGGVGDRVGFEAALKMGYAGCQLGTRFIASIECSAHPDYKRAIIDAKAVDIALTNKISGVPVAVIKTPALEKAGLNAGPIAARLLRHPKAKRWMRSFYSARSIWSLKRAAKRGGGYADYWQAGQSVQGIDQVHSAGEIVRDLTGG